MEIEINNFTDFIQQEVGAKYQLRTILDNLDEDEILESIEDYVKFKLNQK